MNALPARRPALRAVGGLLGVLALVGGQGLLPLSTVDSLSAVQARVCGPVVTQPLVEPPWGLTRLRPDLAWPLTRGAGVRVAVIDSGVSDDHASLRGKVLSGIDYVSPGAGPGLGRCDENGHGTLIAGIIAGRETVSGGFRFYGVAPDATIVPIRVLRDQQVTFETDLSARIADAIRWAVDVAHADVINLSLTTQPTPSLQSAIQHALNQRVVVVAAAGNEGASQQPGQLTYPAAYPGVIGVAGVDQQDQHVDSSTSGDYVDVAAPGVRIAGPSPAGGGFLFSQSGGTSFATAYVTGVAALIRAYYPDISPDQVTQRIEQTAEHPAQGWNSEVGYGVVDPVRAVGLLTDTSGRPGIAAGHMASIAQPPADNPTLTYAALSIAGSGVVMVFAVLAGVVVARRGRRRAWRVDRL
jgi:type VII secretion-associated serine protease mycosin